MAELLAFAEKIDGYRAKCQVSELNRLARSDQLYTFLPSPSIEKIKAQAAKWEIARACEIVTLHPTADNGYPHTRAPNLICLPLTGPVSDETLLHEALHVHQRLYHHLWTSYSIGQGWWPVAASQIPERWTSRTRINPDTCDSPFWSWNDHYVPLPLYTNEQNPSMGECSVRWYDLRSGTLQPSPPRSFTERYGDAPQPEHPFETGAVEFALRGIHTHRDIVDVLNST